MAGLTLSCAGGGPEGPPLSIIGYISWTVDPNGLNFVLLLKYANYATFRTIFFQIFVGGPTGAANLWYLFF